MNARARKKDVGPAKPTSNFAIRILSVGQVELNPHQWSIPKSNSLYWSIYIPDKSGLEVGVGKGALQVPADTIAVVPFGASAARHNSAELKSVFLHFDIGGLAGLQLADRLKKITSIPSRKFHSQITGLEEAIRSKDDLRLQLCARELLTGVLADCVAASAEDSAFSSNNPDVQKILPAINAIEECVNAPIHPILKVSEMAALCALKSLDFSRIFFKAVRQNPSQYALKRKIAVAVQQLLFSNKSIDEVSTSMNFANRFYFSRMFKDAVGVTPAAYRAKFKA
jgi:AraC-like DNA-binding protein